MILVETSALVAIMLQEDGWRELAVRIEAADRPTTTAIMCFEAVCAVAKQKRLAPQQAYDIVRQTIEIAGIDVVGFMHDMIRHAVLAREHYGKGRHPAALNMGDCLSYAAARHFGAPLLFVGNDFAQTDITPA